MALQDYAAELVGTIPELSILLAAKIVNAAWRNIRNSRLWSFLVTETYLYSPGIITTGTVTVTQLSASVVADTAAAAALNAVALATPPLASRQFRSGIGGGIYNITAWDNASKTLTLDRPYLEATAAGAPYQVYRCYYSPPTTDFLRWLSVYDPDNGYSLKLDYQRGEIDRRDPNRGSQGQPYYIVNYKTNYSETAAASGLPQFELWPHPTNSQGYVAIFRRRGIDLVGPADDVPATFPTDCLMSRVRYYGYRWAAANQSRFPTLAKTDWRFLIAEENMEYKVLLRDARKQDDEIFLQSLKLPQYATLTNGPIDATYLQSHDLGWALGGE